MTIRRSPASMWSSPRGTKARSSRTIPPTIMSLRKIEVIAQALADDLAGFFHLNLERLGVAVLECDHGVDIAATDEAKDLIGCGQARGHGAVDADSSKKRHQIEPVEAGDEPSGYQPLWQPGIREC